MMIMKLAYFPTYSVGRRQKRPKEKKHGRPDVMILGSEAWSLPGRLASQRSNVSRSEQIITPSMQRCCASRRLLQDCRPQYGDVEECLTIQAVGVAWHGISSVYRIIALYCYHRPQLHLLHDENGRKSSVRHDKSWQHYYPIVYARTPTSAHG
ncbi:hypothetical protein BCR43DRAFT_113239 [Syncephalastrum racemosum]|uniref:Uncharacterized protein n=1 Tax=Syncephalastrum racemosum TaxID=13706 RepID=A0A1X2H0C8_SYNRA|nr:hypothetical protein BCR43DRAFT_113239 [Syncephalastrum racemosum]